MTTATLPAITFEPIECDYFDKENLGWANNFWLYGAICVFGFFVILFVLPETKGKSLEQIELDFTRKK